MTSNQYLVFSATAPTTHDVASPGSAVFKTDGEPDHRVAQDEVLVWLVYRTRYPVGVVGKFELQLSVSVPEF